jgi:hypothetical protein
MSKLNTKQNKENIDAKHFKIKSTDFHKDAIHVSTPKSAAHIKKSQLKDKLELSFWDLPEIIIKKYNKIGITRMFEWQAECLMSGSALSNTHTHTKKKLNSAN